MYFTVLFYKAVMTYTQNDLQGVILFVSLPAG